MDFSPLVTIITITVLSNCESFPFLFVRFFASKVNVLLFLMKRDAHAHTHTRAYRIYLESLYPLWLLTIIQDFPSFFEMFSGIILGYT